MHPLRAPDVEVEVPARSRHLRLLRSPAEAPVLEGASVVVFLVIVLLVAAWAAVRRGRVPDTAAPAGGVGEDTESVVPDPGTGHDEQPTTPEDGPRAAVGGVGATGSRLSTPGIFYRRAVERDDVREILKRLAEA